MDEAAKLHAPRWGDPTLADMAWLNRPPSGGTVLLLFWDGFLARYRDTLAPATIEEGQRLVGAVAALQDLRPLVPTAIHGDFRLDNMLFDGSSAHAPGDRRRLADRARRVGPAGRRVLHRQRVRGRRRAP